jgi:hypothetical protein
LSKGRTPVSDTVVKADGSRVQNALGAAVSAAPSQKDVIRAGLLDELRIHLVHVLLGGGTRLFHGSGAELVELERTRVSETPGVTHLTVRLAGARR